MPMPQPRATPPPPQPAPVPGSPVELGASAGDSAGDSAGGSAGDSAGGSAGAGASTWGGGGCDAALREDGAEGRAQADDRSPTARRPAMTARAAVISRLIPEASLQ